jgi:hypothetical protein
MPVIGYNPNIPAANNNPSQDQPKMQTNTNAINTLLSLDHFTFADSLAGRHKQVSLTNESAPGLAGGSGVLYANLATGQSWPFWQNALGSIQLAGPTTATANNGTEFLPGGIILKWGLITPIAGGGMSTPFVFVPPFPTACFNVQLTLKNPSGTANTQTASVRSIQGGGVGFTYNYTGGSAYDGIYWLAVGN